MNFLQITGQDDFNTGINYMEMSNYNINVNKKNQKKKKNHKKQNAITLFFQNQDAQQFSP